MKKVAMLTLLLSGMVAFVASAKAVDKLPQDAGQKEDIKATQQLKSDKPATQQQASDDKTGLFHDNKADSKVKQDPKTGAPQ